MTGPALPDCVSCDAAGSLEAERSDYKGSIWCWCTCCGRRCLVKDGRVVYPPTSKVDSKGVMLRDDE